MIEIPLRFFDLELAVRTDSDEVERTCRSLFGRFIQDSTSGSRRIEILSSGPRSWRIRDSVLDAEIEERSWLPGIITARLLETAGNEVTDHDLFHAGAVSHDGHGLLIVGESSFGKSSLSLGLLARGWGYLSDEVGAIQRTQPVLSPFPKPLEVEPRTIQMLELAVDGVVHRGGKVTLDPGSMFGSASPEECRLGSVVFLVSGDGEPPASRDRLTVVVHRRPEGLIEELQQTEGIRSASWDGARGGYPMLALSFEPGSFAYGLDELLGKRGVLVLDSSAEERPPANFDGPPSLEPMGASEGVFRLMGRFRGRRALARHIAARQGGFSDVFLSLLDRLRHVRFHRLRVGHVAASLDLLEEATRPGEGQGVAGS